MALILAIEPDKRQASQLTAMVRGRLRAELVLGESADRALAALGDRVPDLILTAALLPPKDESALGERLRSLNGAAAHVQTLTIPVLASSGGRGGRAGGLLSALKREKTNAATPDGCDPAVFAEQCKEYLERAATEREQMAGEDHPIVTQYLSEPEPVEDQDLAYEQAIEPEPEPEPEPLAAAAAESFVETAQTFEEPAAAAPEVNLFERLDMSPAAEPQAEPVIETIEPLVAAEPVKPAAQAPQRKPKKARLKPLDGDESPAALVAVLQLLEAEQEQSAPPVAIVPVEAVPVEAAPQPVQEPASRHVRVWPALEELTAPSAPAPKVEAAPAPVAPTYKPKPVEPSREWMDIIEQLRRDAEQLPAKKTEKAEKAAAPAAPAPKAQEPVQATPPPPDPSQQKKKPRRRSGGSGATQDEWGFFDPDQCGFAALLEKLEEITDKDDVRAPRA